MKPIISSAGRAGRVFVISDLHMGGVQPTMMSRPVELANFINSLPSRRAKDERLELVIAGDFVDFLSIPPFAGLTTDPSEAVRKLQSVMSKSPFGVVFDALGRFLVDGHQLTLLVGNHDVELTLPNVQSALITHLGVTEHDVLFIDDNRAYRVGNLLIEHGNRYDGANENDWSGLRAMASALSRGEMPPDRVEVSAGSRLVECLISPLKGDYPFIDLLQPQGELVALLLLAFEPSLAFEFSKLGKLLKAKRLEGKNITGLQPGETRHVAFSGGTHRDVELERVFGKNYQTLISSSEAVSAWDVILAAWHSREDSLSEILDRGDIIPIDRIEQLRVAMRLLLLTDESDKLDGDTEQYGAAAKRMIETSKGTIETVVMGHTHLARHIGSADRASYINTGSWADVIRVPVEVLNDGNQHDLQSFLTGLRRGEGRHCLSTYADIRVEIDGRVSAARLLSEGL